MPSLDPLLEPTPPLSQLIPGTPASSPAAPAKLCLLVVFNHRFEANLPKLDWLYGRRFEHVRYLMPFYRGSRSDVIPVYNSSFQFQGFFLEAWKRLRNEGFTHYLIVADDMVLNPRLTGENFLTSCQLGPHDGYIKHALTLADRSFAWFPTASALVAVAGTNGVNWQGELPSFEAAKANLEAKGFPMRRIGWHNFRARPRPKGFVQFLFYLLLRLVKRRREPKTDLLGLPYPLLSGNADIMVVPAAHMEKFSFYNSVLAAMGVFVEVAAPTALGLACPRVLGEADIGDWVARDYYAGFSGQQGLDEFCRQHDFDLEKLLESFDARTLLLHPIKLSRWKIPSGDQAA